MQKSILAGTAAALVLTVSGAYLGFNHDFHVHAAALGAAQAATITVMGHADEQIAPDKATVNTAIVTNASDAVTAQQKNAQLMQQVIVALNKAGVPSTSIHTTWYNIHPTYGPPSKQGQQQINGFQASDSLQISVPNLKNVGAIIDTLVQAGVTQINGVNYQVSNPLTVQNKLYAEALTDAKAQAENIAKSLGVDITGVQTVDTTSNGVPGPIYHGAMVSAASAPTIGPSAQDITANVKVVYTISSPVTH
jgi:uncharacterized protein YggE